MSKAKMTKNVTIGKIVLSLIAIGVLFIPVYAVQSIEARAVTHALELEGLYVNGSAINIIDFDNDTQDQIESYHYYATANYTSGSDSVVYLNAGAGVTDILYRDRAVYIGDGSYAMTYNISEESGSIQQRKVFIPLDINATDFISPDFVRIQSDWEYMPQIVIFESLNAYYLSYPLEVSEDNYIFINTIQTRSILSAHPDSQIFITYNCDPQPETFSWTVKIQQESYTGADIFTWNDDTLYIVSILLCNVLLIGAIVFASDPIDIKIDKDKKRR